MRSNSTPRRIVLIRWLAVIALLTSFLFPWGANWRSQGGSFYGTYTYYVMTVSPDYYDTSTPLYDYYDTATPKPKYDIVDTGWRLAGEAAKGLDDFFDWTKTNTPSLMELAPLFPFGGIIGVVLVFFPYRKFRLDERHRYTSASVSAALRRCRQQMFTALIALLYALYGIVLSVVARPAIERLEGVAIRLTEFMLIYRRGGVTAS